MAASIAGIAHLQIPLQEILDATNNFSDKNIIGRGGFGNVYRGKLERDGKKVKIAARRLDRQYGLGDVEFWTEVSMLSSLQDGYPIDSYPIVKMIGFCDEKGEKIVINQHYPKGSLSMYISNPTLAWIQRLQIARSLCWGLEEIYTRLGSDYIIHRNINNSTVLIDDQWLPKFSGFEFSVKHIKERRNQVVFSEAIGTQGYIDPAIEKYGGVTPKSDIYSLGVVLFELLCGRKAFQENKMLAPLVKFHYENGTLKDIIHPDIWNQMDPESFKHFSKAAYSCLEEDPAQRPDVTQLYKQIIIAYRLQFYKEKEDAEDERNKKYQKDELLKHVMGPSLEVEKREHLRTRPTHKDESRHLSNYSARSSVKIQDSFFYKTEIKCDDSRYASLNIKDELPKRQYTVMQRIVEYKEDMNLRDIRILSNCRHPNIQSFLGSYDAGSAMLVFYEYISLKYLEECLNDVNLTWEKRLKICIDVANGLHYLHNEMEDQKMVIHGDINSKYIELHDIMGAKIIGFENSVIMHSNQEDDDCLQRNKDACNKYYMDPKYVETGKLERESDVFSFGVVMFEILCGMRGDDVIKEEGNKDKGMAPLARRWIDEGTIKKKLATGIKEENYGNNLFLEKGPNKDSLETFINITYKCLTENQNERPDIVVVIKELQKALLFHDNHKDPLRMSHNDIKLATQDFDRANCIGEGGFGLVYKGKIAHEKLNEHSNIVAKKLDKSQGQGEKQYYNELQILYEYNHENIIGLIGYSNETDEKLIVYEHASKGSLDKHLNNVSLTWRNRLKICIDVATGLNFLHEGIKGKGVVIHRDIKTANILVFEDWKAKLGDFGLSLISTINKKTNFTIDHPCGTKDYVDPMYLKSGILTIESDVYSLGVALFEILCGKATYTIHKPKSESLLSFIQHKFEDGKQDEVVFKAIKEEIEPKSLTTFLDIVYKSLDNDREKRPTTKEVLTQLKKALEFQDEDNI